MDSVFRSAMEKLEREHRESKASGKLKLEREKKAKDAAERQRQAIEASQRYRRLESIEAQMKVEDNLGEDSSLKFKVSPGLMLEKLKKQEARVEGGSDKQSRLQEYLKDYYAQEDYKFVESDDDEVEVVESDDDELEVVEWDDDEVVEWGEGDVEGKGDLKATGGGYSLKLWPLWMIKQGMKMRQEAKVDGASIKDSKLQDAYRKAYHALLNQPKASVAANANCKVDLNVEVEEEDDGCKEA